MCPRREAADHFKGTLDLHYFDMADVIVPVRARRDHACSVCVMKVSHLVSTISQELQRRSPRHVRHPLTHLVHPPIQLLRQMLSPDTAALAAAEHALRELEGMTVDFAVHLLEVRVVIRVNPESHPPAK